MSGNTRINRSVYTSVYNLKSGIFDLEGALANWLYYAAEIVVATLKEEEDEVMEAIANATDCQVVLVTCDTDLSDPQATGLLKNAALQACSHEVVIQQDLDERLSGNISLWDELHWNLLRTDTVASFMLPVIDLIEDYEHYCGHGRKWYLHRKTGCFRGAVSFAIRDDGTIDTERSDTCELIDAVGNLVPTAMMCDYMVIDHPKVFHLGYLDLDKRIQSNKNWQPVWSAMRGENVSLPSTPEEIFKEKGDPKYLPYPVMIPRI